MSAVHELTTRKSADHVEKFATANDGTYAYKYSGRKMATLVDDEVITYGDGVVLTALDGVFIGEVEDIEPEYGVLYLRLS